MNSSRDSQDYPCGDAFGAAQGPHPELIEDLQPEPRGYWFDGTKIVHEGIYLTEHTAERLIAVFENPSDDWRGIEDHAARCAAELRAALADFNAYWNPQLEAAE